MVSTDRIDILDILRRSLIFLILMSLSPWSLMSLKKEFENIMRIRSLVKRISIKLMRELEKSLRQ
jgi:hypothetical protein